MQKLEVNFSVPIPEDLVLIKKVELQELKEHSLTGVYWSMKDLEDRTGKKQVWIKENILYPTRFKKILDVRNGGFVFYPEKKGQTWAFQANKMAEFLDKYFADIFKGR